MQNAIALLDQTFLPDANIKASLYYFWTKTTKFNMFSTIDVSTSVGTTTLEKTLYLLNKYYNQGFRIFFGFSTSTILSGCLPWFNEHPDAIGVSPTSSSDTLNVTKNVYRLQPTDQTTVNSINVPLQNSINAGGKIHYVYSDGEIASSAVLDYLNSTYGASNIVTFPVAQDSSNLTLENIGIYYQNATSNDVALTYLYVGNQRNTYYSYFNNVDGLDIPVTQYDMTLNGLPTIDETTSTLKDKLFIILNTSVTNSALWNDALIYLKEKFTPQVLNSVWLITNLVNVNDSILNIYSYDGVLQFNEYNDIKYYSYGLYKYTNDGIYAKNKISIKDPAYGDIVFDLVI